MATVQDYLNMAVSMTVGNKSGTDNQVLLPNDFRKFENLRVKEFKDTKSTVDKNTENVEIDRSIPSAVGSSFFLVFFSHPVKVTAINTGSVGAAGIYTSFVAFGRNLEGTAIFDDKLVKYSNTLKTPEFVTTGADATEMADVEVLVVEMSLGA